jgi:SAM-dependent methyltransferase
MYNKATTFPSDKFSYYKKDIYWNDFECVRKHLNLSISGSSDVDWMSYLKSKIPHADRGFILNCGNGWVERDLFQRGVLSSVMGVDFMEQSIEEAIIGAKEVGMPAIYFKADCNMLQVEEKFPIVVNHAAMHHVTRINHVKSTIAKMILSNGIYIGFDYVGPHRNQYSPQSWFEMVKLNNSLPKRYRAKLTYPHLKTMLHTDPSEAVHSELILSVMKRYFDLDEYVELGGGVAYQILFQNLNLYNDRNTSEGLAIIQQILKVDEQLTTSKSAENLFSFWIARPKKNDFPTDPQIAEWQLLEDEREASSIKNGGRYYLETPLEIIYNEFEENFRFYHDAKSK